MSQIYSFSGKRYDLLLFHSISSRNLIIRLDLGVSVFEDLAYRILFTDDLILTRSIEIDRSEF